MANGSIDFVADDFGGECKLYKATGHTGTTYGDGQMVTWVPFYWNGTSWISYQASGYWNQQVMTQNRIDQLTGYMTAMGVPHDTTPSEYWPDGPPEGCASVDCTEKTGEQVYLNVAGIDPPGPFCDDNCNAIKVSGGGISIYDPVNQETTLTAEYTGDECTPTDVEPEPDPDDCNDKMALCNELCPDGFISGLFICTEGPPVRFDCGCQLPPYPLVREDDGKLYPDQDNDQKGSSKSDTDNDDDGKDNGSDDDINGNDLKNGDGDPDTDGNGLTNGGTATFNPTTPTDTPDGSGRDPDVNGDGRENGIDPNVDGDGATNCNDADIDGDGVLNYQDVDADGDGVLNSADATPFGAGCDGSGSGGVNGDDPATTTSTGEDETTDGLGEPTPIVSGSCPTGQVCIGDGVCQSGESPSSVDCAGETFVSDRISQMMTTIKGTGIGSLMTAPGIPSGGSSTITVGLGTYGEDTFDFNSLSNIWSVLGVLFLLAFGFVSIRIITLKR